MPLNVRMCCFNDQILMIPFKFVLGIFKWFFKLLWKLKDKWASSSIIWNTPGSDEISNHTAPIQPWFKLNQIQTIVDDFCNSCVCWISRLSNRSELICIKSITFRYCGCGFPAQQQINQPHRLKWLESTSCIFYFTIHFFSLERCLMLRQQIN